MRDEELRSRLQALAVAGQVDASSAAIAAVRRRSRRKVQGGVATVLVVGLLLSVAGMQLRSELGDRRSVGPVPPVAPPSGPPAAVAPATFVGQVGTGGTSQTMIIDARTGRIVRQVPGSERRSELAADAVVSPDLRTMYLPATRYVPDTGPTAACDPGWTEVDLATGARRPAFDGLTGVEEFSLSADGRSLAYVHTTATGTLDRTLAGPSCHRELVVRELASGRERSWTIPAGVSVDQLQLNPDATRLAFALIESSGGERPLRLLPLAGTTSVTQGSDVPPMGDCPLSNPRFLGGGRLMVLGGRGCDTGPVEQLAISYDFGTGQATRVPLGLPGEIFSIDVDRSGQHVIIAAAGRSNDQRPATVYLLRDGRLQRVPFPGDCWQADW